MAQPSLFSADLAEPELGDLAGLLAAHGQITAGAGGARLSILLAERWRADAIAAECAARDIATEIVDTVLDTASAAAPAGESGAAVADLTVPVYDDPHGDRPIARRGTVLLRTERTERLTALAASWSRGAVKAAPDRLALTAGLARIWLLAAGRTAPTGFGLGLDPHAAATFQRLVAAAAAAGIPGTVVGVSEPTLRITGRKSLGRLAGMVGTAPPGATAWP